MRQAGGRTTSRQRVALRYARRGDPLLRRPRSRRILLDRRRADDPDVARPRRDGKVWLVDPVDWPGDRPGRTLGEPAAVLQLLDRHNRDCAAIAARSAIPHLVVPGGGARNSPFEVDRGAATRGAGARLRSGGRSADAGRRGGARHESVLPERRRPGRRPPAPEADAAREALGAFEPEHLLVGHGEGRPRAVPPRSRSRQALARSRLAALPRSGAGFSLPRRAPPGAPPRGR